MSPVAFTFAAAVTGGLAACAGMWLARGSTAVPAGMWALVAWLAVAAEAAARLSGGLVTPAAAANVRLVVTALAVCPTLSLLGAKRPQHGVWQFIVATLAVVLALPAASAALARPGSLPAVHPLESWLVVVIVVVGWLNFVGTRRAAAATLIAIAQLVIMRPFLPLFDPERQIASVVERPAIDAAAAILAACAALGAAVQGWLAGRIPPREGESIDPLALAIGRPFRALRETLGAAWSLRIAERFDAVATARGWPCRLRFQGLEVDRAAADHAWQRDAQRAFTALMRRFVTDDWLRRHAGISRDARTIRGRPA